MCIRVSYASLETACAQTFDDVHQVVTLPGNLPRAVTLSVLRTVLEELAIPQQQFGAICWCGEQVSLLPAIPSQQRREQVKHGA